MVSSLIFLRYLERNLFSYQLVNLTHENPVLWTGMKGNMQSWFFSFLSSRTCFGISVLISETALWAEISIIPSPPAGEGQDEGGVALRD